MYRVYVYRTNEIGEVLSYCMSRRFDTIISAEAFAERQNKKPKRKAEICLTY